MPILSTLAFLGLAFAIRDRLRIANSTALLVTPVAVVIALYAAAMFSVLLATTIALQLAGLASLAYFGLYRQKLLAELPLTPILLFFLSLVFWAIHRESSFAYYDEYSHWGVYLRDMLAADGFWDATSNAWHLRNLPGATLWQYFFARFSDWPEGAAFLAQFLLVFGPLMVFFERLKPRQLPWALGIFALLSLAILNFGHGFISIYVDHVIGAWFAGILLNVMYELRRREDTPVWIFGLPLTMLAFLKAQGFFFMLAAAGIVGLFTLLRSLDQGKRAWPSLRTALTAPLIALSLSVAITGSWELNRDSNDVPAYIGTTSNIARSLVDQESVFSDAEKAEISRRFFEVLSRQQISKDEVSARFNAFSYPVMSNYTDRFRLTTFSFLLLTGGAVLLAWLSPSSSRDRRDWLVVGGLTWLTTVAYLAVLFYGYRYIANDLNGFNLSSFIRYSHSMLLPLFLVALAPLVPAFRADDETKLIRAGRLEFAKPTLVFALALAALYAFETPYPKNALSAQSAPAIRLQTEIATARLRDQIGEAPLWVFFPNNVRSGMIGHILQFQLSPGRTQVQEDLQAFLDDPSSFESILGDYEYAWFPLQSPEIDAAIATLAGTEPTVRMFRVVKDDTGIRLDAAPEIFAGQ